MTVSTPISGLTVAGIPLLNVKSHTNESRCGATGFANEATRGAARKSNVWTRIKKVARPGGGTPNRANPTASDNTGRGPGCAKPRSSLYGTDGGLAVTIPSVVWP